MLVLRNSVQTRISSNLKRVLAWERLLVSNSAAQYMDLSLSVCLSVSITPFKMNSVVLSNLLLSSQWLPKGDDPIFLTFQELLKASMG